MAISQPDVELFFFFLEMDYLEENRDEKEKW